MKLAYFIPFLSSLLLSEVVAVPYGPAPPSDDILAQPSSSSAAGGALEPIVTPAVMPSTEDASASATSTGTASPAEPTTGANSTADGAVGGAADGCFPYGAKFTRNGDKVQPPTGPRSQWWCPQDRYYGWLGYVRDLKGQSCSDPVYSLETLRSDFKKMSSDGARMVRIYGPICPDRKVWDNVVQAAAENNLGVLGIVWHGYDPQEEGQWLARKNSLLQVLRDNPLAKYVIHSVSFGSEPLFSWNIANIYESEFKKLKGELQQLQVPITVSEMKYGFDQAPKNVAETVKQGIDFGSAHIMPYYGNCNNAKDEWPSITKEIADYKNMLKGKPVMVTQNPWGSSRNGRNRGGNCGGDVWKDVSVQGANDYWRLWTSNCKYFKEQKVGWFAHVFNADSEANFGIYGPGKSYQKVIDFKPTEC